MAISAARAPRARAWVDTGEWTDLSGRFSYEGHLYRVRVPLLVIAGHADNLATVESVRAGYDGVSSLEKAWVVLGRESGALHDYGHMDMTLSERATTEVFPYLWEWLSDARAPAPATAPAP